MDNYEVTSSKSEILLYQTEDGKSQIQVKLEDGTVWLTQSTMAELYQTTIPNINLHIQNVLSEGELNPEATIKEYLIVQTEGSRSVKRKVKHYNLDMILAVGYRVRSHRGTQFRQWATECLKEFLVKGFILDDERLKAGRNLGKDYFDELLARIQDIRASEKRFYQKLRDIFSLSIDFDPTSELAKSFFTEARNKLYFAITGKTSAELIAERVNVNKLNMGLTNFDGNIIRRKDVLIAKNYLNEDELITLNRFLCMYLDYAEDQSNRRKPLYMKDWYSKLNIFIRFNEREILDKRDIISSNIAAEIALNEFNKYEQQRLIIEAEKADDFDGIAKEIESRSRKH